MGSSSISRLLGQYSDLHQNFNVWILTSEGQVHVSAPVARGHYSPISSYMSSFSQTLHELTRYSSDSALLSILHPPHIKACFLIEHFRTDSLNLPFTTTISESLSWAAMEEEKMRQLSGAFATKCYRKEPIASSCLSFYPVCPHAT